MRKKLNKLVSYVGMTALLLLCSPGFATTSLQSSANDTLAKYIAETKPSIDQCVSLVKAYYNSNSTLPAVDDFQMLTNLPGVSKVSNSASGTCYAQFKSGGNVPKQLANVIVAEAPRQSADGTYSFDNTANLTNLDISSYMLAQSPEEGSISTICSSAGFSNCMYSESPKNATNLARLKS